MQYSQTDDPAVKESKTAETRLWQLLVTSAVELLLLKYSSYASTTTAKTGSTCRTTVSACENERHPPFEQTGSCLVQLQYTQQADLGLSPVSRIVLHFSDVNDSSLFSL